MPESPIVNPEAAAQWPPKYVDRRVQLETYVPSLDDGLAFVQQHRDEIGDTVELHIEPDPPTGSWAYERRLRVRVTGETRTTIDR
jgi:hypothetical protein